MSELNKDVEARDELPSLRWLLALSAIVRDPAAHGICELTTHQREDQMLKQTLRSAALAALLASTAIAATTAVRVVVKTTR